MRVLIAALLFVSLALPWIGGTGLAMDEAILTPTSGKVVAEEEKEFNDAMGVWLKHRYSEGEKKLREFSKNHPGSRWAAEADLHVGCYLTFRKQYPEAREIFERLIKKHPNSNIRTKAKIRLGNVAERSGQWDEAIRCYSEALHLNPTWDQFKYANYRARRLIMSKSRLKALTNCGPVALAACLDALGKKSEAAAAKSIQTGPDGVSMAWLMSQSVKAGVTAQAVEMEVDDLKTAALPVLAYVEPNHFVAVLELKDGKARLEDSITGKYELGLDDLKKVWSGRALVFAKTTGLALVPASALSDTVGGCCGQGDEDECMGSCEADCNEASVAGVLGGGGGGCTSCGDSGGSGRGWLGGIPSPGRPTWKVNTANLNLIVQDTPIWYNPGAGPKVAFTLTYSNENSNSGIFGRGWRCPYDMKVFFLPAADEAHPSLQVHRDTGRIETYEWDGGEYVPRAGMQSFGYRDTASKLADGTVVLSLRGGGKYYFRPEGDPAEGRIWKIEDTAGKAVTCEYDGSNLARVVDVNGRVTTVTTTGSGLTERVSRIDLPASAPYVDGRYAEFTCDEDLNLVSITDMAGSTSTMTYDSMCSGGSDDSSITTQDVTATDPPNGGVLGVYRTHGFAPSGKVLVTDWASAEYITYESKTSQSLHGITRGTPACAFAIGTSVLFISPLTTTAEDVTADPLYPGDGGSLAVADTTNFPDTGMLLLSARYPVPGSSPNEIIGYTGKYQGGSGGAFTGITRSSQPCTADAGSEVSGFSAPYLRTLETPFSKTKFTYEWWTYELAPVQVVALHEAYECGPDESDYPSVPTMHFAWCSVAPQHTSVTRYPSYSSPDPQGCLDEPGGHWKGGQTAVFTMASGYLFRNLVDPLGNTVLTYGYTDGKITSVTTPDVDGDGQDNATTYEYDGNGRITAKTDPLLNVWRYTWENNRLKSVVDPYERSVYTYTHDPAGRVTKVDTPQGTQSVSHYNSDGKLDYVVDGEGGRTVYAYNENGETRGFLTSVIDPAGKATHYVHDDKGRLSSVTDPNQNTTTYTYDDLDRLTRVTHPDGAYSETHYACCYPDWSRDENGKVTAYEYDSKSRLWLTILDRIETTLGQDLPDSGGVITLSSTAGLPSVGSILIKDPSTGAAEIVMYTGISGSDLTGVTRGTFGTSAASFPQGSAVIAGTMMRVVYDAGENWPCDPATTQPCRQPYLHRVVGMYDGRGKYTSYTYLANDLLERVDHPDGSWESYTYNGARGVKTKTVGRGSTTGRVTSYEYDANGRVIKVSSP